MERKYISKLDIWIPTSLKTWMKQYESKTGLSLTSQVKIALLKYKRENDENI